MANTVGAATFSRRFLASLTVVASQRSLHVTTLAFASLHEWTPSPNYASKSAALLQAAEVAGVGRIAFLRHGNTGSADVDIDRQLTETGRKQARQSALDLKDLLEPLFPVACVSPAPRTLETAQIFFSTMDNDSMIEIHSPASLYDGTMQPAGSALFSKIGYAPLSSYLDNPDPMEQAVAQDLLGAYATMVTDTFIQVLRNAAKEPSDNKKENRKKTTLCFVGHAIYLPSAAFGVATLAGCREDSTGMIVGSVTKEAEGYLIDLESKTATYLSRTNDEKSIL